MIMVHIYFQYGLNFYTWRTGRQYYEVLDLIQLVLELSTKKTSRNTEIKFVYLMQSMNDCGCLNISLNHFLFSYKENFTWYLVSRFVDKMYMLGCFQKKRLMVLYCLLQ